MTDTAKRGNLHQVTFSPMPEVDARDIRRRH